jgi:hypothetical protein
VASMGQSGFLAAPATVTITINSVANGARAVSTALDNATDKALWAMLELVANLAVAPVQGAALEMYLLPSIDETNFADGDAATAPNPGNLAAIFTLRAVTGQRLVIPRILLPPGQYKWLINNTSGQAFAASGNVLRERRWELESA